MFESLRDAFREAVANFKDEMARDEVPQTVDRLLAGMLEEVTAAKTALRDLEDQVQRTRSEAAKTATELETYRRRERMAGQIGDQETARVAREFAEKSEKRRTLLEHKAVALEEELEFRKSELDEMLAKIQEARSRRDSLAATAGRTGARESIQEADDLFGELDRMAAKIQDEDVRAHAAEAFGDLDLEAGDGSSTPPPEIDFDARLAELKRRMQEG